MAEAPVPTVPTRRQLRVRLRQLRLATPDPDTGVVPVSASRAARRLGLVPSTVSRIESGEIEVPKPLYVETLCQFYGADPGETELLVEAARTGRRSQRFWFEEYVARDRDGGPPKFYETYIRMENEATHIDQYDDSIVSGLLQTEEYARELFSLDPTLAGNRDDVEEQVAIRMGRQKILDRPVGQRPELHVVMDESVLRRPIGGQLALKRQLEHLLTASERPNVELQLLPFEAGGHAAMNGGSFIALQFANVPGDAGAVYSDNHSGALILEGETDVQRHRTIFASIQQTSALTAEESRVRIKVRIKELDAEL